MNVVCPACHGGFQLDEIKLADDALLICPECMAEFSYGERIVGEDGDSSAQSDEESDSDIAPLATSLLNMDLSGAAETEVSSKPSSDDEPHDAPEASSSSYGSGGTNLEPEVIGQLPATEDEEEPDSSIPQTTAWSIPDDFGADYKDPFAAAQEAEEKDASANDHAAATVIVSSPLADLQNAESNEDPFAAAQESADDADGGPATVVISSDVLKSNDQDNADEEVAADETPSMNSIPGLDFDDLVFLEDKGEDEDEDSKQSGPPTASYLPNDKVEYPEPDPGTEESQDADDPPLTMSSFEGNMLDDLTESSTEESSAEEFVPDAPMLTQSILDAEDVGFEDFLAARGNDGEPTDGGAAQEADSSEEIFDLLDLGAEESSVGEIDADEGAFFVDSPSISTLSFEDQETLADEIDLDTEAHHYGGDAEGSENLYLKPEIDPLAAATGVSQTGGNSTVSLIAGVILGVILTIGAIYAITVFNLGPMLGIPQFGVQRTVKQTTKDLEQIKISSSLKAKDSPGAYADEINRLEGLAKKLPDDGQLNERIAQVFARYHERFPIEFQRDQKMKKKWNAHQKVLADPVNALYLKAVLLLSEGSTKESLATLQTHLALRTQDDTVAYLLAKIRLVEKDYKGAEEILREIVDKDANDTRASFFLAQALSRQSKFEAAEKFLDQIFKLNPDHLEGRLEFAQNLVQQGKYKRAQEQASQILELANQRHMLSAVYEGHLILSRVNASLNEPEKRAEHLTKALEIDTTEPVLLDLVNLYLERANFTRAGETLRKCKEIKCGSEAFFTATVSFLVGTKQPDKAEAWANKGLEKFTASTALLLQKAEAAERRNQLRNARSVYERIAELKPEEPEAYVRLSRIFIKEKNFIEVEKVLQKGLGNVTNQAPLLNELVTVYEIRQNPLLRKDTLRRLVQLEPSNANYRVKLARAYSGMAMHQEALEQFTELLRLGHIGDQEMVEYVKTLLKLGKLEEAKIEAEKYYKIKPNNVAAGLNLGEIHYQRKEYKEAEKYLLEAIALDSSNAHAHYVLGVVYEALGQVRKALTHLAKASSLTPNEENTDYRFKLAEVLIRTGEKSSTDQAVHHLTQLIKLVESKKMEMRTDRVAELYHLRGNIRFDRGGMPLAFRDFKKALALDTDKRSVLVDYGKALYMTRKLPESKKYMLEVVDKEPYHPVANLYLGKIALKNKNKNEAENRFKIAVKLGGKQFPSLYKDLGYLYYEKSLTDLARSNFEKYLLYSENRPVDADEIEKIISKL